MEVAAKEDPTAFLRVATPVKTPPHTAHRRSVKCTVGQPEEVKMAATAHLPLVASDNEKFTVLPAPAST